MKLNIEKAQNDQGTIYKETLSGFPSGAEDYGIAFAEPVSVEIGFVCHEREVLTKGVIRTAVDTVCDRCLDPLVIPLEIKFDEVFDRQTDEDEHYLYSGHEIDLDRLILEAVMMETPVIRLCREDCKGLCPQCGANLNRTNCGHEIINRRPGAFDDLAGLFEDNEEV